MRLLYALAILVTVGAAAMTVRGRAVEPEKAPKKAQSTIPPKPAALPKDVYADSLGRLPLVKRDELDERGKKLYDLFASPEARSVSGLRGPFGVWLYSDPVAEHAQALNFYLRYETDFGRRLTELGILVSARELDSQYEWTMHEPTALKAGLEPEIVEIVKYRKGIAGLGEKEATIISFGRELFGKKKVSSQTFAKAEKLFGKQGVVNLAALMGDYASVTATINAFDLQLLPDQKPLLPMP